MGCENLNNGAKGSDRLIGIRVHMLREAMGLSLRDLSGRCGVSSAMLSQVERGDTSPTVAVAQKIASGLGLSLSQLLRLDEGDPVTVVRSGDRMKGRQAQGHSYEVITPASAGQRYQVSLHSLEASSATAAEGDPPMHEPGSRETVFVQKGTVSLTMDGCSYSLYEGDSVTFDADLPHHFENSGRGRAEMVAVVSAGLRTSG